MTELIRKVQSEVKAKLLFSRNIQNKTVKAGFIFVAIGLIALKIFTTVLTFDWLASLFN